MLMKQKLLHLACFACLLLPFVSGQVIKCLPFYYDFSTLTFVAQYCYERVSCVANVRTEVTLAIGDPVLTDVPVYQKSKYRILPRGEKELFCEATQFDCLGFASPINFSVVVRCGENPKCRQFAELAPENLVVKPTFRTTGRNVKIYNSVKNEPNKSWRTIWIECKGVRSGLDCTNSITVGQSSYSLSEDDEIRNKLPPVEGAMYYQCDATLLFGEIYEIKGYLQALSNVRQVYESLFDELKEPKKPAIQSFGRQLNMLAKPDGDEEISEIFSWKVSFPDYCIQDELIFFCNSSHSRSCGNDTVLTYQLKKVYGLGTNTYISYSLVPYPGAMYNILAQTKSGTTSPSFSPFWISETFLYSPLAPPLVTAVYNSTNPSGVQSTAVLTIHMAPHSVQTHLVISAYTTTPNVNMVASSAEVIRLTDEDKNYGFVTKIYEFPLTSGDTYLFKVQAISVVCKDEICDSLQSFYKSNYSKSTSSNEITIVRPSTTPTTTQRVSVRKTTIIEKVSTEKYKLPAYAQVLLAIFGVLAVVAIFVGTVFGLRKFGAVSGTVQSTGVPPSKPPTSIEMQEL